MERKRDRERARDRKNRIGKENEQKLKGLKEQRERQIQFWLKFRKKIVYVSTMMDWLKIDEMGLWMFRLFFKYGIGECYVRMGAPRNYLILMK